MGYLDSKGGYYLGGTSHEVHPMTPRLSHSSPGKLDNIWIEHIYELFFRKKLVQSQIKETRIKS